MSIIDTAEVSARGRAQREQSTSMRIESRVPAPSSTFPAHFGTEGLTGTVRAITATLLKGWDEMPVGRRMPSTPSTAKLKADIRDGKVKPVEHLLRICYAAIDAGIAVEKVTLCLRDMIASVEQYAARKRRRETAGLLTFGARFKRLSIVGLKEQSEADIATLRLVEDSLESLEDARRELLEEMAADAARLECLTTEIAYRRSKQQA